MPLPNDLQRNIVTLLTELPNIHDSNGQRALVLSAGLDAQLQHQIVYGGPPGQFVQLLITTLESYGTLENGRGAVEAMLEAASGMVGKNKQAHYRQCISELQQLRQDQRVSQPSTNHRNTPLQGGLHEQKRIALKAQLADLYRKYRAANAQLTATLSEVEKITIKNQITHIEQEIQEIETKLNSSSEFQL